MNHMQENRNMLKWRVRLAAFALALLSPLAALAQNKIQSITSTQQAGADVVRIELSEALTALPTGFAVQTPPRIAIDLQGVVNAIGKSSVEVNQGNLRSVNIAQAGERTRLVLNLRQASNYRAELQGKALLLVIEAGTAPNVAANTGEPTHFSASQNREQLPLRDIDFRRGPDGAGRVVVSLASTQV
ncbi:AMIN domain-containing protein, partial [Aquabacterium sp.]|uniref:AMIN domain-containing protein n=1 Tax=Aquabacterium sp. TaxID=1872578 RepID=UPI002B64C7EE